MDTPELRARMATEEVEADAGRTPQQIREAWEEEIYRTPDDPHITTRLERVAFDLLTFLLALAIIAGVLVWSLNKAVGHEWYPPHCCSGHDCRAIQMEDVELRPAGFFVKESGETIPYDDKRIRRTPPEGGALYHRCSRGGKPEGETICLYIPNWGA